MPFRIRKNRYVRPKRRFRRRPRRSTFGNGFSLAKRALTMAMGLKKLLNVEHKFHDVTANNGSPDTTGLVFPLTAMSQGTTALTRLGNSVKLESSYMRAVITKNASATQTIVRLIMFVDNETQGANAAVTDVLEAANVYSPINHLNGERFTVLVDRQIHLDNTSKEIENVIWFRKLGWDAKYNDGNAGNVSDCREKHVFLLWISNEATNKPTIMYNHRLRFIDN